MCDVSVILVTYNSDLKKIKFTLNSLMRQKGIILQIIVADDGSFNNYSQELKSYFKDNNFINFTLVNSEQNKGTVRNIANAVRYAKGKYTKTIAPGDFFANEQTLQKWIEFMERESVRVSFGEAAYYSDYQTMGLIRTKGSPSNKALYNKGLKYSNIFVDYLLANDTILGAALFMDTKILKKYIKTIENRIIYAEDFMIRIMIYDGIEVRFYPNVAIWYEYGTGISTSKNKKWEKLLHNDFEESNKIIEEREPKTKLQKKYIKYLSLKKHKDIIKLIKVILFPKMLYFRIKMRNAREYTPVGADKEKAKIMIGVER